MEKETIVIFDLKNLKKYMFNEYYNLSQLIFEKEKNEPNKSKEEIEVEIKKEIKQNINEFIKGKKDKYYNIDENKSKELDSIFKQIKLKVVFNSSPKMLNNEIFYTYSEGKFDIYNNKNIKKLFELNFEKKYKFKQVIQLDNKDLVFFNENGILLIYKLQNENYVQKQIIYETRAGYQCQMDSGGCCSSGEKYYFPEFIKKISDNRFICVSNYGFKIYSLNEKNEYSAILIEEYYEGIKLIHELDNNNFIFCTEINYSANMCSPSHNEIIIAKIKLKDLANVEKEKRLKKVNKDYYNYYEEPIDKQKENAKKAIESLKLTAESKPIYYFNKNGKTPTIKNYVVLKNKYFVVSIDNTLLIFDLISNEQLKIYELLINGEDNLYFGGLNLKKWICQEDNKFFICINGNFILFELTNDIELKIINQSYFPYIRNLKILSENNNQFYDDFQKENYMLQCCGSFSFRPPEVSCDDYKCLSIIYQ